MLILRNSKRLLNSILRHIELDRQHNSMQPWRIAAFAASQDVAALVNAPAPTLPIQETTAANPLTS